MKISLASIVRDRITGARGIVVGRAEYLDGTRRVAVQRKANKDGSVPDLLWIDEFQLEVVGKAENLRPSARSLSP